MIKHLRDLWILKDCGILIFSKVQHHHTDDQCLGGLTSALYYFTQKGLHEKLERFTTDKHEYILVEKEHLLFLATFPPKIRDKTALHELHFVADKFLKNYPKDIIEEWDHNMNLFIDFDKVIRPKSEILGEFISTLWNHRRSSVCSNHSF